MIKPKQVKYLVTGPFGLIPEGTVISSFLIVEGTDTNYGLLYHPGTPEECPSMEICWYNDDKKVWVSTDKDVYINLPEVSRTFERNLFGKDFKPKRVVYTTPEKALMKSIKSKLTAAELQHLGIK